MSIRNESTTQHDASNGSGDLLQLVSFHVGDEEFGLDILRVQEIIRIQPLTRVPNLPDYIDGVINLRGKVIPVIGLRKRLGLDKQSADKGRALWSLTFTARCWDSRSTPSPRCCAFTPTRWKPRRGWARSIATTFPALGSWTHGCCCYSISNS